MHTYQKNTNLFGNAQNVLFNFILREWSFFYSDIGCSESKVIFKWLKTTTTTTTKTKTKKKALQGENVCTSCISFSLSENSHKTRLEAAVRDAQTIAQTVFPPRRPTLTSRSLQSICAATFSWILWKLPNFMPRGSLALPDFPRTF